MLRPPRSTAPAAFIRSTREASAFAGGLSRLIFEPARVVTPCDVEEVLDRIGHAGERQRLAGGDGRIDRVGLAERAVEGRVGEGAEARVGRLDAGDRRLGHVARR